MLLECPVCHQPQSWVCALRPLWSQWHCARCGSLLGIDARRRVLSVLVFLPAVMLTLTVVMRTGYNYYLALVLVLIAWIPLAMLIDRPRVIERGGFRCRGCGYDLRGQVAPRCPECGRELDDDERATLVTGEIPGRPARRPERLRRVALLIAILVGLLVAGLFVATLRAPTRPMRLATQPAATQPGP